MKTYQSHLLISLYKVENKKEKIANFNDILRTGTTVYVTFLPNSDFADTIKTVKKLKPKKFKFKDVEEMEIGDIDEEEQENKEKRILEGDYNIGFIAQEVEEVIPEIVKDKKHFDKEIKTLDYEKLTAVLIKAVQEQQQQINKLEEKLNG